MDTLLCGEEPDDKSDLLKMKGLPKDLDLTCVKSVHESAMFSACVLLVSKLVIDFNILSIEQGHHGGWVESFEEYIVCMLFQYCSACIQSKETF